MSNESKCFIHSHWHNAFFFLDESLFLLSSIKKVKREAPNPFSYFVRFEDFCQARCSALKKKAKQHKSEYTYTYMRDRTGKNSWLPLLFFFFFIFTLLRTSSLNTSNGGKKKRSHGIFCLARALQCFFFFPVFSLKLRLACFHLFSTFIFLFFLSAFMYWISDAHHFLIVSSFYG